MTPAQRRRLGDQIRAAVKKSELAQNEIARRSGIDKGLLSRFMSETGSLSLDSIERLAGVLDLQIVEGKNAQKK
jgi:transcriptional regulator with XRE-family HTH domain